MIHLLHVVYMRMKQAAPSLAAEIVESLYPIPALQAEFALLSDGLTQVPFPDKVRACMMKHQCTLEVSPHNTASPSQAPH